MERGNGSRRDRTAPNKQSYDRPPADAGATYREHRERRRARAQDARMREEAERNAYQARRRSLEEDAHYVPLDDNMSDIAEERSHGKLSPSSDSPSSSPLVPSPLSVADLADRISTMGPAGGLAVESSRYQATREGSNSSRSRHITRSPFAGPQYFHERPTSSPEHPQSRVSSRPPTKNRSRFTGLAEQESAVARKTAAHIAGGQVRKREPVVRTPEPAPTPDAALALLARTPAAAALPAPPAASLLPSTQPNPVTSPRRLSLFRRKSQEALEAGQGASKAITGILKLPAFRRTRSGGEPARSRGESSKSGGETTPRPTTKHASFRGVRFGFLTSNRQPGDSSSSSSGWSRQTQPPSRARSGASIPAASLQSRSSSGSLQTPTTSPRDDGGPSYVERQGQIIQQYEERQRQGSSELQRAVSAEIHRVKTAALEERAVEMGRNAEREEQAAAAKAEELNVSQARVMQRQVEAERKARDDAEAPARQKRKDDERARVHRERMVAELERRQLQREEDWARERERERERVQLQEAMAREEAELEELRRARRERGRRERGSGKTR